MKLKNLWKRGAAAVLALVLALGLTACGGKDGGDGDEFVWAIPVSVSVWF